MLTHLWSKLLPPGATQAERRFWSPSPSGSSFPTSPSSTPPPPHSTWAFYTTEPRSWSWSSAPIRSTFSRASTDSRLGKPSSWRARCLPSTYRQATHSTHILVLRKLKLATFLALAWQFTCYSSLHAHSNIEREHTHLPSSSTSYSQRTPFSITVCIYLHIPILIIEYDPPNPQPTCLCLCRPWSGRIPMTRYGTRTCSRPTSRCPWPRPPWLS